MVAVFTVLTGVAYPLVVTAISQVAFHHEANGSLIERDGVVVGSELLGQNFTAPEYFHPRPSAAGDGYDPLATSASNLGPESVVDTPGDPSLPKDDNGYKASLLTLVCARSASVGELEGVDGSRPFCTGDGVGAVLSVIGPRDSVGNVIHPTKVVSVNEPCNTTRTPFLNTYEGVRVECAKFGEDYSIGQIVPIRGAASADPQVPADAVTASGSGLDPHISIAYADLQVNRVAKARGVNPEQIQQAVVDNTDGRWLGFMGEPRVNVLKLNLELDQKYPAKS